MHTIAERYLKLGYTPYRWFHADTASPWQPLRTPLRAARLGLVSTSGAYALGQVAYHYRDDATIRAIDATTADTDLRFSHLTENYLVDARRDPACMFPLATLRGLVGEGFIGRLADRVLSCMGGVYSQRRVREETAPAMLAALRVERVDAVLLVAM
jgi:hypothetical protein